MSDALLDLSRRTELGLHGRIVADLNAVAGPLGIAPLIVGAFARDLLLRHAHNIAAQRATEDLDFAVAVPAWAAFAALRQGLINSGRFSGNKQVEHRLRHRDGLPIDLVPFDRVERRDRKIAWPPRGEIELNVFGFREAMASAEAVMLPGAVRCRVVSLPALALLKLVCWSDRRHLAPRKDAADLHLVVKNYLRADNEARLFDEFVGWTQEDDFDYESSGARMLGHDIRALLGRAGRQRIVRLLTEQASTELPAHLPAEMSPADPDRARQLLAALLKGLQERG